MITIQDEVFLKLLTHGAKGEYDRYNQSANYSQCLFAELTGGGGGGVCWQYEYIQIFASTCTFLQVK